MYCLPRPLTESCVPYGTFIFTLSTQFVRLNECGVNFLTVVIMGAVDVVMTFKERLKNV